jgi:hypothetical protein
VKRLLLAAFCLTIICPALADLTFPALFKVVEEQPGEFTLSLTVPMIKGRYMKVKPVVPENFQPTGEPEVRAGSASLTRSWKVTAKRSDLYNALFGLEGLQGTVTDVRFVLTTLDGRRYEAVLRPTQPLFLLPPPEDAGKLASGAAREGLRHSVRSYGLWLILASILWSALPGRIRFGTLLLLITIFTATWAASMNLPRQELSDSEYSVSSSFYLLGVLVGSSGVAATLELLRSFINEKIRQRCVQLIWIPASAWLFYQAAGLCYYHGPVAMQWLKLRTGQLAYHWFSPFATDWTMARLRIPMLSILSLILLVFAMIRIRHRHIKLAVSSGLFMLVFILLPYGVARATVPFKAPEAPSARQAHRIIEPMLREIYHALNLQDENQTYDKLAEQVAGDLVTDLYLDSRRRLIAGAQDGVSVQVKQVQLESIEEINSAGSGDSGYRCCWSVIAKVTHWQHTHERRNLYKGDLRLTAADDRWKLAGLDLRSEEREVVPGSFKSR